MTTYACNKPSFVSRKEVQQPNQEQNVPLDLCLLGTVLWLTGPPQPLICFSFMPASETAHEGRVSGLQQCNNFFFFPALSYDPMILACEGAHSSSHM